MKSKSYFHYFLRYEYLSLAFFTMFVLTFMFNIWRAKFGIFSCDESLYLAIPYRMLQGDLLLLNEWNLSQMSSFFLYPILKVYLFLFRTTDGIALSFRYIYIVFHNLVSLYIYLCFNSRDNLFSHVAGIISAIFYSLFCYSSIMALSYNTIAIGLMIICCLSLYLNKRQKVFYLITGAALAGAVLCCPYVVSIYILYSIAVFIKAAKIDGMENSFSISAWIMITLSCFIMAMLFFLPLICSGKLQYLLLTLPQILSDPSHPQRSLMQLVEGYITSFFRYNFNGEKVIYGSLFLFIILMFDKKRISHRSVYMIFACVLALLFSYTYLVMYYSCSEHFFSCTIIGFFAYLLTTKKNKAMFVTIFIPGVIFSMCKYCSSNMEVVPKTSALSISMIASVFFLLSLIKELLCQPTERASLRLFNSFVSILIFSSVIIFLFGNVQNLMKYVYFDMPPTELYAEFQHGTSKGLKSTPENVDEYDKLYEILGPLRDIEDGNVLYLTPESRLYLEDPKKCSSFSMWFWTNDPIEHNVQLLSYYWELFPDKKPDYIYFDKTQASDPAYLSAFNVEKYKKWCLDEGFVLCLNEQ